MLRRGSSGAPPIGRRLGRSPRAATVGLNEAEALLVVVELYGARVH